MRFWVGVAAAFGAGGLIGTGVGILLVEDKLKKEYAESTASHWRMVQAVKIDAETPSLEEQDIVHIRSHDDGTMMLEGGPIQTIKTEELPEVESDVLVAPSQSENPYHKVVEKTAESNGFFASYAELSEEDYQEDDGRDKEIITMIYTDGQPMFFIRGEEIDDAFERVGGTIVDDMRKAVEEGNPIVWVRNNQTETDYEVIFEQP